MNQLDFTRTAAHKPERMSIVSLYGIFSWADRTLARTWHFIFLFFLSFFFISWPFWEKVSGRVDISESSWKKVSALNRWLWVRPRYVLCVQERQLLLLLISPTVRKPKERPNLSDIDHAVLNVADTHVDEVSAKRGPDRSLSNRKV